MVIENALVRREHLVSNMIKRKVLYVVVGDRTKL